MYLYNRLREIYALGQIILEKKMEKNIFGYIIYDSVIFEISSKNLFQYRAETSEQPFYFRSITLNETQCRLLAYLLEKSKCSIIDKNEVMMKVWDEIGQSSSNQRLWQSMNDLRKKLSFFELPSSFITNVHGVGYALESNRISVLYMS